MAAKSQAALPLECRAPLRSESPDSPGDCLRRLFVAALTEQGNVAWKAVSDHLSELSTSDRKQLAEQPDILHYIRRTVHHADRADAARDHVDIVHSLSALFPEVVEQCRKENLSESYDIPHNTPARCRKIKRQGARKRVVSLDSGLAKLLTFSPEQIPATFRGQGLQLNEVAFAATAVSHDLLLQTKRAFPLSPTHLSLPYPTSPLHHPPSHETQKPALSPVYHWQLDAEKEGVACRHTTLRSRAQSSPRRKVNFEKTAAKPRKEKSTEAKLHTAYDVIAAFASGSLQAGAESVYLNYSPSSPWNPYNLSVVSKTRASPEHYLISKFGVLHVQPDGSSDLQSFADWLREASLFSLCQHVPYFRQFLLRKAFRCWYRNVCYQQFVRLYSEVDRVGLRFFPNFHEAVDKIHKLNTELLSISMHTLTPLGGHTAEAIDKRTEEMEARTRRLLQRYFKYCKRIVTEAIGATSSRAEKLEEEKKHQPFVSDSPISVQVEQHAQLEKKLGVARYRVSRLPDFVRLAEQMIGTCLLQVARQSGRGWVEGTLGLSGANEATASASSSVTYDRSTPTSELWQSDDESTSRQGPEERGLPALLVGELRIGEGGIVLTEPSEEKIVSLLTTPLHSVMSLLSSNSSALTASSTRSQSTPLPHLPAGEEVRDDEVKMLLAATRGKTRTKPLLQALQGLNIGGGKEVGLSSVLESSRARLQLEGVGGGQGAGKKAGEEGGLSNPDSPLMPHRMRDKLQQDPVLQTMCSRMEAAVNGLQSAVSSVCQQYSWLGHAHSLIAQCKRDKTDNMTAHSFECVLRELHVALDQISHLPSFLPTSRSLVTISTGGVASLLAPQLQQAVARLQSSLSTQARDTASRLLTDAIQHTQELSSKRYDLEGFVQYARSLRDGQSFNSHNAANTQWVADVYAALRKYSIQPSEVDRVLMQRLQSVWREFEASLAEGAQFVETQTPLKAQGLQESISVLEEDLERLLSTASKGDFIDPSATPHVLLTQLDSIQQEMSGIRSRLIGLSKWEEAITGKHHNLSRAFHCFKVFYARQELWKYRRQFDSCEHEWFIMAFRKLDISYVEQKVSEWWEVFQQLGETLQSDDPVLQQWREKVERMHTSMPILKQLASKTLQRGHWHTIFAALNAAYDSSQGYTLHYFLERELQENQEIIAEICCLASQQSRLREKISGMEQSWSGRTIDLHQTSAERYTFSLPRRAKQRSKTISFLDSPADQGKRDSSGQTSAQEHLYSVRGGEDLLQEMASGGLDLRMVLSSPHVGGLKVRVESLRSSLSEVSEILSFLMQCQDQWQDLLELFLFLKPAGRRASGLEDLRTAGTHFKEIMLSIRDDPRVFSLLSKSRGQKGFRELQGHALGNKIRTILNCMEAVMAKLDSRLEEVVCRWPRLGYLTQRQRLKVLACRGNLLPIIPLINRVFPSINTLHFVETSFISERDSSTGYQVTGVEGALGEHLSLVLPLPVEHKTAVEWLAGLEQAVRFSLASRLTDCLSKLPPPLTGQPLAAAEGVVEWLRSHVQQNVLLALDMHWSARLQQAFSDNTQGSMQTAWSQLQRAMENAVQLLLRHTTQTCDAVGGEGRERRGLIAHVLRSVIIFLRRKTDFAHSLLTSGAVGADPWQLHLHYTTLPPAQGQGDAEEGSGGMLSLPDTEAPGRLQSNGLGGSSLTGCLATSKVSLTASRSSLTASRTSLLGSGRAILKPLARLNPLEQHSSHLLSSPHLSSPHLSSPPGSTAASRASLYSSLGDHLHISPPAPCTVHIGGSLVDYAFEYYGPTPQLVMTPTMESSMVAMATAIVQYTFPEVTGGRESHKTETAKEVAKLLGRHCYLYCCSALTSPASLLHLLHSALPCGSLLVLESPHCLSTATGLSIRCYLHSLQTLLAAAFAASTEPLPPSAAQQSEPNQEGDPLPTHDTPQSSHITASRLDWYATSSPGLLPSPTLQSLDYMGRTVAVSPHFGCCVILASDQSNKSGSSNQFEIGLRSIACVKPDMRLTTEVLLSSYGFSDVFQLSKSLEVLSGHLQAQLSGSGVRFNLSWLHRVLSVAASLLLHRHSSSTDTDYCSEEDMESAAISGALLQVTAPLVPPDQVVRLGDIVATHLPSRGRGGGRGGASEGEGEEELQLVRAVNDELRERHLQTLSEVTEKIVQLHHSMGRYSCTVLLGPRGCGITTCYRTLSAAYQRIGKPPTDIIVINPAAYSWEQLFGGYHNTSGSGQWINGILTRLILQMAAVESHSDRLGGHDQKAASYWVVLDGPLIPHTLDTLATLLSDGGLCLPGMERVTLPSSCRLLLKPGPLPSLSPAILGRCGLLHWSCNHLSSDMLVDSWLDRAPTQHDLSSMTISYLGSILQTLVPDSMAYLSTVCSRHHGHLYSTQAQHCTSGAAETRSLLALLSAMLERNCPTRDGMGYSGYHSVSITSRTGSRRDSISVFGSLTSLGAMSMASSRTSSARERVDDLLPLPGHESPTMSEMEFDFTPSDLSSAEGQVLSILSFAFIWSIGAYVPFSEMESFNTFAREQIEDMPLSVFFPQEGSVFDFYLNLKTYKFEPWSERKDRSAKNSSYIPTPELSRVAYIAELYLSYGYNVMLMGERGSGKTSFVEHLLQCNMSLTRVPITHSLSAPRLHTAISDKVTEINRKENMKWGSRKLGIGGTERCLFFLDDLHLCCNSGPLDPPTQPGLTSPPPSVVEMVLFASRHCCLLDYPQDTLCYTDNVHYIASCLPGDQYTRLPQLLGSFHPVPLFPQSDGALHKIFSASVQSWFKRFPNATIGDPEVLARALSAASVATFRSVCTRLQPSPTQPHCLVSMQHLMHVYNGLMLMPLDSKFKIHSQFNLLSRRGGPAASNYGAMTSKRTQFKSGRKEVGQVQARPRRGSIAASGQVQARPRRGSIAASGQVQARPRMGSIVSSIVPQKSGLVPQKSSRAVRLPPMKREGVSRDSSKLNKLKSELKKQQESSEVQATLHQLVRLWCHENTRAYADRMADSKDRMWFVKLLEACVKYSFCGVSFENFSDSAGTLPTVGTAVQGTHRGRGGRGRANKAAQSVGLSLSYLVASGVRVDVLQRLLPRAEGEGEGGHRQLIPFDQVFLRGEDITGLIFCQLPAVPTSSARNEDGSSSEAGGGSSSDEENGAENKKGEDMRVYQELGDGQVLEAMEKHLHHYFTHCARENEDDPSSSQDRSSPALDLVLFRSAVEHAARLCRVLGILGCHALLLGGSGSGRKCLCRFVAHMMRAELFEISDGDESSIIKEQLRGACSSAAGEQGFLTILLVSCSGRCWNTDLWASLLQLMSEGMCSGLFSSNELILMRSRFKMGRFQKNNTAEAVAKSVLRNLHIVVVWDLSRTTRSPISTDQSVPTSRNGSAHSSICTEEVTRRVYASLCGQCCVVDHYQAWGRQELSEVAQRWWQERSPGPWQGWVDSSSQLEALANLAAHVHLTSLSVLDKASPHLSSLLLAPTTFSLCLITAYNIGTMLQQDGNKGSGERLRLALERLAGVEAGEGAMRKELAALQPELRGVETQLEERNRHIEACQQRYKVSSQRCREAKATIDTVTRTVEDLRSTVAQKTEQVSPLHLSAIEALSSVKKNDLLEVMSYREPPAALIPVFNTLCMLFDRPQTWEECKQLLLSPNFFESLKFFDKDGLSRGKLRQLESMLSQRAWRSEALQHASMAVSSLGLWVLALLDYHRARDVVNPFQDSLTTAEKVLTEAEVTFVAMQRDMLDTKAMFKAAQRLRNVSLSQKASIEAKIADVQQRLDKAGRLLSTLSAWKSRWEQEMSTIQSHILSSPGHAVLAAAGITYLSRVPPDNHRQLWDGWLGYCAGRVPLGSLKETASQHSYHSQKPVVQVETDFSLQSILSSKEERSHWNHYASFPDTVSLERCLSARTCLEQPSAPWPLLLDPHQLFQQFASELEFYRARELEASDSSVHAQPSSSASSVVVLRVSGAGWAETLNTNAESGQRAVVLILDQSPSDEEDRETLERVLRMRRRRSVRSGHDQSLASDTPFRLYLVLEERIEDCPSPILHSLGLCLLDFSVVNMALSPSALEGHLLKLTLRLEHPEYAVRHRALLVDRTLYEKQVEDSKEQVIAAMLDPVHLLGSPHHTSLVRESEQNEATALEYIQDTNKALGQSRGLVDSYRPFAHSSVLTFTTAQRLCTAFNYRSLSLAQFQEVMAALVVSHKHIRPPDNPAACHGHVLHLQKKLLLDLHRHMKRSMFQRHHILLPLCVHLRQLLAAGKIGEGEYRALGEDSGLLQSQLDALTADSAQEASLRKPNWLSPQSWNEVCRLEQLPAFAGLSSSLASCSESWREYCELGVCMTIPTPLHPSSPHPYYALLLWRALRPDKFPKAVEEFISLALGPEFTPWGESFTSQDPLDLVLSTVAPRTPVACLLRSQQDEAAAARLLEAAARERGVKYRYVELPDTQSCDDVMLKLGAWSGEGGWVVVAYSYLLSEHQKIWQLLVKTLRENESGLQVWVTVPLSLSSSVEPSWPCLVQEEHHSRAASRELLADVRRAVSSPSATQPPLGSLQRLLPAPLSQEELTELSPTQRFGSEVSQSTASFLFHELQQTNSSLSSLHASLQWIQQSASQLSPEAVEALAEIAENKIPRVWHGVLPAHLASLPSLLAARQLLQAGMEYLVSTLKNGWSLSVKLHPLWVSDARDLMSRVQLLFAEQQQISPSEVSLLAEVQPGPFSHSRDPSLTFHSLSLHGATWDPASSSLTSSHSPSSPVYITLTPVARQGQTELRCVYQCPVFATADEEEAMFHIPLPASSPSIHASLHCLLQTTPSHEYS